MAPRAIRYPLASILIALFLWCCSPTPGGSVAGDVTVYKKIDFDDDTAGFKAVNSADASLTKDAVTGTALRVQPQQHWGGVQLGIDIEGSTDLKLAFLAKAQDYPRALLNVFDQGARDNTTSYAYRYLRQDEWTPVVYYLDTFRYNSKRQGTVAAETSYASVRFFASEPSQETEFTLDNFVIYRGHDSQPPDQVAGLRAVKEPKGVRLSWDPGEDSVGIMGYVVSRRLDGESDFSKVAEVHRPEWTDQTAATGSADYRVLAFDFERNLGDWSIDERVQISAGGANQKRSLSPEEEQRSQYAETVREVHERGRGKVRKGHVFFFGDSLTRASEYPRQGQAAMGIFTTAAYGSEGKRTDFGRDKVQEILAKENPEFLLVLFGTNNLKNRNAGKEELATWMDDMEAIASAGHANGTVVVFGTVPPRGFKDPESKPEVEFNQQLKALGRQLGVPVADIFAEVQTAGDRRDYLAGDGVHWKKAGMAVAGQAWAKTMRQVEWVLRDR